MDTSVVAAAAAVTEISIIKNRTSFDYGPVTKWLKQVLSFLSEGQKTDGPYTRSVWTDETEPQSVFNGLDRPCVRNLIEWS